MDVSQQGAENEVEKTDGLQWSLIIYDAISMFPSLRGVISMLDLIIVNKDALSYRIIL